MKSKDFQLATKTVHAGKPDQSFEGAVCLPIFQTANFLYAGEENYHAVRYTRLNNNPNQLAVSKKLAQLENAESAVVTNSGMTAITSALLTILSQGDHILFQDSLYGGTFNFVCEDLPQYGIDYDFIDGNNPESWNKYLRENTRAIYVESMSNPLLKVTDLKSVVQFAQKHGIISLIDNTFPSPINFRPAEWGFDLSLHSCTKYLNGHSDIIAGAVIGKSILVEEITKKMNHLGGSLDPHACFLLDRGIKTLALRMERHNHNAGVIAEYLNNHPAVTRVNYPGLASHPNYDGAKELFDGYSGMMSVELRGGVHSAEKFIERLSIITHAASLGGVETLITRPATTSHLGLSAEERKKTGITEGLIRLSVGIEAETDLLREFERALKGL